MRFHLIDALRGIAAIWVVFYHAFEGQHLEKLIETLPQFISYLFFEIGDAGVPIFFVLSGFVIAHSVTRDNVNLKYLGKFTLRRSIRLDPPYWGSIVLVIMMGWLSATIKNESIDWPSFEMILAHLFYLQNILELGNINSIYWTLCIEIQFYLIFVILVSFKQRLERYYLSASKIVFLSVALVSLLWPTGIIKGNLHPGLFLPYWHAFLLGVFVYWSWQGKLSKYIFYIYFSIVFVFSVYHYPDFGQYSDFCIAAALTSILIHELSIRGHIVSANWRWIQFLGTVSYSLYLTHNTITGSSYFLIYKILGDSLTVQFFAFIITTMVCILFAYFFWFVFEKWSIKFSKKIKLHRGNYSEPYLKN